VVLAAAGPAHSRPVSKGNDARPNILVVMTDDMSAADLELMPNVQRLLAKKGTTFADAIDSFPLCCPARATFITGQYAHNHGVKGNFAPYGWYGMRKRGNTLPAWLQDAGYRTALIGKWLNGYGALDAHGEVPKGFGTWRGLLDVSAYDYSNFVMNADGKLRVWGDDEFARKLVEFAIIEVDDEPDTLASIFAKLEELFGPRPYSYWGAPTTEACATRAGRSSSGGPRRPRTGRTWRRRSWDVRAPTRARRRATSRPARRTSSRARRTSTRRTPATSPPTSRRRRRR
jgi:hypothetical protein